VRGTVGLHADVLDVDGLGEADLVEAMACFWFYEREEEVSIFFFSLSLS